MQSLMIGLGRMDANMLIRPLTPDGHRCVVHDMLPAAVQKLAGEGAISTTSLHDVIAKLEQPLVVSLMVPAPLFSRLTSRGHADVQNPLLFTMRSQFGGHVEKDGTA